MRRRSTSVTPIWHSLRGEFGALVTLRKATLSRILPPSGKTLNARQESRVLLLSSRIRTETPSQCLHRVRKAAPRAVRSQADREVPDAAGTVRAPLRSLA